MRLPTARTLCAAFGLALLASTLPASAQSVGYVTGFPGKDPAGDEEIGWGPAYRPETSFSQPYTPPTPGDFAGAAYRARTGRGVYDHIQDTRGMRSVGYAPYDPAFVPGRVVRSKRALRGNGYARPRQRPTRHVSR